MESTDENYLDNLLNSVMTSGSAPIVRRKRKENKEDDPDKEADNKSGKGTNNGSGKEADNKSDKDINKDLDKELEGSNKDYEIPDYDMNGDFIDSDQDIEDIDTGYNIFDDIDDPIFFDDMIEEDSSMLNYEDMEAESLEYTDLDIKEDIVNNVELYDLGNTGTDDTKLDNTDTDITNEDFKHTEDSHGQEENSEYSETYEEAAEKSEYEYNFEDLAESSAFGNITADTLDYVESDNNGTTDISEDIDMAVNNKEPQNSEEDLDGFLQDLFQSIDEDEKETSKVDYDMLELLDAISTEDIIPNEAEEDNNVFSMDDFSGDSDLSDKNAGDINPFDISSIEDSFGLDELLGDIEDLDSSNNGGKPPKEKKRKKNKKGKSLFKRLFANVQKDISEEELTKLKEQAVADYEAKEQAAADNLEKKALAAKEKEEKKKKADEEAEARKVEAAKAKEEKAKQKKAEKEAKKDEKIKRQQEIQELIDDVDESMGRLNKIGTVIIFVLCAAFAIFVVVGTNILTYNKSMEEARNYYERRYYNEAFDAVYGLTIKEEDVEFYDKLITVMYVNKQLNSYNNFFKLEMYPNALDSLLKGLVLYEKYYTVAAVLDIEDDLDFVRERILKELEDIFEIDYTMAKGLLSNYDSDRLEYSNLVYQYAAIYENISSQSKSIHNDGTE